MKTYQWTEEELKAMGELSKPPIVTNTPRAGAINDPREYAARTSESELAKAVDRGILNVRGTTHGDFVENGKIMQLLKDSMRGHSGWLLLKPYEREALEMIQHKIGRILCGDHTYYDHWRDIAGYAKLVEERCPPPPGGQE